MISTVDQKSAADSKSTAGPTGGNSTPPTHNIVIIYKNGFAQRRDPMPVLHYGQTVQYTTTEPGAKASMVFPDLSPYLTDDQTNTEIPDSEIKEVVRPFKDGEADFQGLCYLTLNNGQRVGWDPVNPKLGGGDHHVQRP